MAQGDKYEGDIYVRDGMTVRDDQGAFERVDGTQRTNRDLSTKVSWWDLRQKRDIPPVPEGKHWCSHHDHEGKDEHGKDDGGWRPVGEFTEYRDKNGKLRKHEHCNGCRARHERRMYALRREAEGRSVRGYNRREAC